LFRCAERVDEVLLKLRRRRKSCAKRWLKWQIVPFFCAARYLLQVAAVVALNSKRNPMPSNSIYLDSGLWRREQSNERDPLRAFPELFNANATGRSIATENAGIAPEFEVAESSEGFQLSARVPGITAAQLQVRVTAQLVIVVRNEAPSASSTTPGAPPLPHPHAAFRKAFVLPTAVDARRLQVAIEGDLLTIKLPNRARVQSQRVSQNTR
jgi:HSP20 family molecular chaperone IbpA